MSERKPLSLNERHNRVIFDLSSSRPSHNLPTTTEEMKPVVMEKVPGRGRLFKKAYVEPKDENAPEFSGFSDFDSPAPIDGGIEEEVSVSRSVASDAGYTDAESERDELEPPMFSILSDLDSPTPVKKRVEEDDDGGSGIRDILNQLSSRMDRLAIERPTVAKAAIPMGDSLEVAGSEMEKLGDQEAGSRSASFSGKSEFHDAFEDFAGQQNKEVVEESVELKEKSFYGNMSSQVVEPSNSPVVERNGSMPQYSRAASSFSSSAPFRDASKNVTSHRPVDKRATKVMEKYDFLSESESYNVGIKYSSNIWAGQSQVGRSSERPAMEGQRSSAINLESNDDCSVLSSRRFGKGGNKHHHKIEDDVGCIGDNDDPQSIVISGPNSTYTLPGKIAKMLYPHQREGLRWLWSLHCQGKGGILGDDMGLGKTMQICGFIAGLFTSRFIKRVLIVAPKTLLPHWLKELSVVGLSKKTRDYFGTCSKAREYELQYILQDKGILLTTYDIVRNNVKSLSGANYFDHEDGDETMTWDYMILDEGHLIKNPSTQRAKSLLEIPSAHRIIISGTPIQNNLKELWALFNFCCPELLGDKNWFKHKYEHHILRGNDKNASDREKRIGSTVAKELRELIQPYFLRRMKTEVFDQSNDSNSATLSTKNEIIVWLRLTACQQQLYQAFLNTDLVLSAFDGTSPLAALTILKKICDHPLLLTQRAAEDVLEGMDSSLNQDDLRAAERMATRIADANNTFVSEDDQDSVSCKILFILALLGNLIPEGHNVLIFSQTRKMLNLIQESLITSGYEFQRIDGTTKPSDRLKVVNEFQEGKGAPIFLLTSQVGGLGLTLTNADRVIVVDPAWNPSTDNQSVDRAYRIGQKKDVIVYRLMTSGTVEEKIYRKQVYKGGLFRTATEHKEQTRYFSQQDLRELFSLPKNGFDISVTQQQLQAEHGHQQNMNDSLIEHVKFLETLGIAGISNHSLLFSKTAPVPLPQEGDEQARLRETAMYYYKNASLKSLAERNVDGAEFAFKPKDVENKRSPFNNTGGGAKLTESDIKLKINRLSATFADKNIVERLPDKGEKIRSQIAELNSELEKMRKSKMAANQVIEIDDVTEDLGRKLYM